jgi:hypothetical protein
MICAERTTISKTQILLSQYNYTIFCFSEKPWKKDSNEFSFASLWIRTIAINSISYKTLLS